MTEWPIFVIYVALSDIATRWLVPLEHRLNYAQCRRTWDCGLSEFFYAAISIMSAIQAIVAPGACPTQMRVVGLAFLLAGDALAMWAWRVNSLFVPAIIYVPPHLRVTDGPYRFCSHPGYLGFILAAVGVALLLGQWWAALPMVAYVILIIRRMVVEDRILSSKPKSL